MEHMVIFILKLADKEVINVHDLKGKREHKVNEE
jgi:hypothetical protein